MEGEWHVQRTDSVGPVVFCLHGLLGGGPQFDGLASLHDNYCIAAWDAPGYGRSPDPADGATLQWYAHQAASAIEAIGDTPVHLLGVGWGGMVAMQLAASRGDLVKSMILVGSQLSLRPGQIEGSGIGGLELGSVRAGEVREVGYTSAARSMLGVDLSASLRGVTLPCLVIMGEDAGDAEVQDSQDVSAAIADAVFVTMRDAGNLPHLRQPVAFGAWLRSFLFIVDRVRDTGNE